MKNVLIISTSIRNGSNSEILAKKFLDGALESKHNVEFITLKNKEIKYCLGCLSCQKTKKCIIKDDVKDILGKIRSADVIAFATPVYFYEMCGQMKTLLDRTNPLYSDEERKFKDFYLIATCADDSKSAIDRVVNGLQGWIDCFDDVKLKGVIYGVSVNEPNEVNEMIKLQEQAFEMGKAID